MTTTPQFQGTYVLDDCHSQIKVGDVFAADFRGWPGQRFEVIGDTGQGMFEVLRPDGSTSPMRPSTILAVAVHIGSYMPNEYIPRSQGF